MKEFYSIQTQLKSHMMHTYYESLELALVMMDDARQLNSFLWVGKDCSGNEVALHKEFMHVTEEA